VLPGPSFLRPQSDIPPDLTEYRAQAKNFFMFTRTTALRIVFCASYYYYDVRARGLAGGAAA